MNASVQITSEVTELNEDDNLMLECVAASYPLPSITWLWQDTLLLQDTTETVTVVTTKQSFYEVHSRLERSSLIPEDSGEYKCRLDNPAGGQVLTDAVSISVMGENMLGDLCSHSVTISNQFIFFHAKYLCMVHLQRSLQLGCCTFK